jgi:hypothetical protein
VSTGGCVACKKARDKAYYEANREKRNALAKAYNEANREKVKARRKAYYWAYLEKKKARCKAYRIRLAIAELPDDIKPLRAKQYEINSALLAIYKQRKHDNEDE